MLAREWIGSSWVVKVEQPAGDGQSSWPPVLVHAHHRCCWIQVMDQFMGRAGLHVRKPVLVCQEHDISELDLPSQDLSDRPLVARDDVE